VSAGDYALGLAGLGAIVLSLAVVARSARRALLPDWTGPPALLAEAILGIGAFILISELLGVVGLLDGVLLVIACPLAAAATRPLAARAGHRRSGPEQAGPVGAPAMESSAGSTELRVAIALALLVALQWAAPTLVALDRGIYGGDSLWYHLPFTAHIAQTGSVTELLFTDPLYLQWFYPQNSELLHAGGLLLLGNDFLSPLLNMAWLGLALLAGWCAGRPYRAGAATLAAVAALMSADLLASRQPGNANNDVVAITLLLAAAAILITAGTRPAPRGGSNRPPTPQVFLVAGLAAGLALGTKLTVVAPIAALTVGVIAIASPGTRARVAAAWGGGLIAGGCLWYLRNLIVSGNPLPWIDLGPISRVEELQGRDPHSIAHYLTDTDPWGRYFIPGLDERLGELWPLALALAIGGVVVGLASGRRVERMLAVVALVSAIAYVLTPLSAAGPDGMPTGFRLNMRYLTPALVLAYVLVAIPPDRLSPSRRQRWTRASLALFGGLTVVAVVTHGAIELDRLPGEVTLAAAVVALPVALVLLARRGMSAPALAAGAAAAILGLALLGRNAQQDYLSQRYSSTAPGHLRPDEHPSTELSHGLDAAFDRLRETSAQRIALSGAEGAFYQYGLWGKDSSNRVRYLGRRGDRGSFHPVAGCPEYLAAINDGEFDYVVTTPSYDQDAPTSATAPVERGWLAAAGAERVAGGDLVDVWRPAGPLDPSTCPA
jgi:hypothetical protein